MTQGYQTLADLYNIDLGTSNGVKQYQNMLNKNYNANLSVDGNLGNLSQGVGNGAYEAYKIDNPNYATNQGLNWNNIPKTQTPIETTGQWVTNGNGKSVGYKYGGNQSNINQNSNDSKGWGYNEWGTALSGLGTLANIGLGIGQLGLAQDALNETKQNNAINRTNIQDQLDARRNTRSALSSFNWGA